MDADVSGNAAHRQASTQPGATGVAVAIPEPVLPACLRVSPRNPAIAREQLRTQEARMSNNESIERVAGPRLCKRGCHDALIRTRGHPNVECTLQRADGVGGRGANAADLVEELQLQRNRRRDEQLRASDQRLRFFGDFFGMAAGDPDDDVGIKTDGASSDHSWDQSSSTRSSGSPLM